MKKWNNAEFVTVEIAETAYGKNYNAREANANKHPNKGAGGSLNPDVEKDPDYTEGKLSGGEQ